MTDANVVGCSHDAELDAPRLFAADQMRGHDISGASVALAREVGSGSIALRAAGEDETRARLHDPRNERAARSLGGKENLFREKQRQASAQAAARLGKLALDVLCGIGDLGARSQKANAWCIRRLGCKQTCGG
jgi:hypothetical protein